MNECVIVSNGCCKAAIGRLKGEELAQIICGWFSGPTGM